MCIRSYWPPWDISENPVLRDLIKLIAPIHTMHHASELARHRYAKKRLSLLAVNYLCFIIYHRRQLTKQFTSRWNQIQSSRQMKMTLFPVVALEETVTQVIFTSGNSSRATRRIIFPLARTRRWMSLGQFTIRF